MLFFPDEQDTPWDLYGDDFAKLSQEKAEFIKIKFTDDREEPPFAEDSVVPTSKLLSDNPSREYDVPVGEHVVVVCDWFGNEYFRTDCKVKANKLEAMIDKVADLAERENKKLQHNLDKAQQCVDKKDDRKAVYELRRNFKEDVVGLDAQEGSIRLYHEIMDRIRDQKDEMVKKGDVDGLKDLAKVVKKTDMEKEIDDAIAEAEKVKSENPVTGK